MNKAELYKKLEAKEVEILALKEELNLLKRMIFGKKSERFIPVSANQATLFDALDREKPKDDPKDQQEEVEQTSAGEVNQSKHKGRQLLTKHDHLDVEEQSYDTDHQAEDIYIGKQERKTLAYRPGKCYIRKEIIHKYKSAATGEIISKGFPPRALSKCEADDSLLVHICVNKFVNHLPEYRTRQILLRQEVDIPSSTMNGWVDGVANELLAMAVYIEKQILASGYLQIDESTLRVMAGQKNRTHLGYMWVIYSPELRAVRFQYHPSRNHQVAVDWLTEYAGKYQSDGYGAYDQVDRINKNATHYMCNAHSRRYFEQALKDDFQKASYAMSIYRVLYDLERKLKDQQDNFDSLDEFHVFRQKERQGHKKILLEYKEWLQVQNNIVRPKSPLGKAVAYALKYWNKLTLFIHDGQIEIDNNSIENTIRPLALGRKNYLFAGSTRGAENNAIYQTIFGTCRHLGINPEDYLSWYLAKLPQTKIKDIQNISPWKFKDTIQLR